MNMSLFYTFLLLCLLALLARWIKSKEAEWIGSYGEYKVRKEVQKLEAFSSGKYKAFHNLYIPREDGSTSQIDHIILSDQGLFVIETKNYSGWIFGDETSKYWTQVIYKRKEKFLNPILQNKGHIQALRNWLGEAFSHIPIHSVVVFLPQAKLKSDVHFAHVYVVYPKQLKQVLEQHQTKVIDGKTKRLLIEKLDTTLFKDKQQEKEMKKQHVQTIRAKQEQMEQHIQQNRCPKCGGALVVKRGKYGKFKSCSNYPKCRFTQKVL